MEITARLTADAKLKTLKDERKVVNFNVAINDSYKLKYSKEFKKVVTFIQCDYWMNPSIAQHLTKGTLVELQGRIGVNTFKDLQGEPKAILTFHVNTIKLHGKGRKVGKENLIAPSVSTTGYKEPLEDLPF
ncbi:MAG: single-stranded DNA-binding protein [Flavisolibacter sp.]